MEDKRAEGGFTLAELLIVVSIVGVLVAISIPIFVNRLETARRRVCEANMRSAKMLIASAIVSGDSFTDSITDGMEWTTALWQELKDNGYQTEEEICPSGGKITIHRQGDSVRFTCSVHTDGESGGGGGGRDHMTNEKSAEDILNWVSENFSSPNWHTGEEKAFMKAFIEKANENGGLLEAEAAQILEKFGNTDGKFYGVNDKNPLVWVGTRAFFDGKEQDLLVVTSKSTVDRNQLNGFMFYYNGNYYKSTKTAHNGNYDYASLTQGYSSRDETFEEFLKKNNWELAE
ncbi:prepilin-type N-terminal cleavage/methylation domain-containing protein [Lachnospiraceae bacterium NSJ-143]|nr:prepilin-type N-terminal cleavage/methylation domain-containing protein [Lachnospiraceae bacterium NSJ-143]